MNSSPKMPSEPFMTLHVKCWCSRLHGSNPATQAFIAVNFRLARQPPTIGTWAEMHFYDLPTIRPSGLVNSTALIGSNPAPARA